MEKVFSWSRASEQNEKCLEVAKPQGCKPYLPFHQTLLHHHNWKIHHQPFARERVISVTKLSEKKINKHKKSYLDKKRKKLHVKKIYKKVYDFFLENNKNLIKRDDKRILR